ncbi:MAG TPA: hypothetical protein DEH02_09285 [Bacteroidales bacterium]|nr:MAG: hypothetical protein A2X01_00820 [Bacteroidetes bacterium GWF2_35_48]OFY99715.1 MAG: hypothetical protein A2491_16965 [Bacteroidetes bacterium RIFOXYC12_FULL_35_7]HBX51242.1 hypothetical protein [Bacteroidales bacterium]
MRSLKTIFAGITYQQIKNNEAYFHSVFYLTLKLLGYSVTCEILTNFGRIDALIETKKYIYVIEFKMAKAEKALQQIKETKYHEKYLCENKEIILLGIGFSEKERNIHEWKFEIIKPIK